MPDLQPFTGLRYDPELIDKWGSVLAPPYDVISGTQRRDLITHSPYQITRVESASTESDFQDAAAALHSWRAKGIIKRDEQPAYYLLEQRFTYKNRERTRHCLFLRARIAPWDTGEILPHEWTMSGPKKTRTALRRITRTDISPIFAITPDRDRQLGSILDRALQLDVVAYGIDPSGDEHYLRIIDKPEETKLLQDVLVRETIYIADGHHRYESALADRDQASEIARSWTGNEAENFVLMGLVRATDPGLIVGATHRLLHIAPPKNVLAAVSKQGFDIRDIGPLTEGSGPLIRAMEKCTPGSLTIGTIGLEPGRCHLLIATDEAYSQLPKTLPVSWRKLDIALLHALVLERIFRIDDDALREGGAITYTHEVDFAFTAVQNRSAYSAFILNPPPLEQVFATAKSGDRMPQKSTYFKPKLPTGVVLYPFD